MILHIGAANPLCNNGRALLAACPDAARAGRHLSRRVDLIRSLCVAAALLTAVPAFAQATEAQVDALVKAIAEAGCEVDAANNDAVLATASVTPDQASSIVSTLLGDGRAAIEGGKLRLKTAGCN